MLSVVCRVDVAVKLEMWRTGARAFKHGEEAAASGATCFAHSITPDELLPESDAPEVDAA